MVFNSIDFLFFVPVVFILFWFVCKNSLRLQNILLILASYYFYGCWDYRFLSLIMASSMLDFSLGIQIQKTKLDKHRKGLLWISILANIGILGFFKYFNFFIESAYTLATNIGWQVDYFTLNILLPVGISFYTFQTLSYTIDVYKKEIEAIRDPFAFFAFVAFFPQLVAGPIERAKKFLPQFSKKKEFDYESAVDGCRQMLWGFFKKIVIADNCAPYVDQIFAYPSAFSSPILFIGAVLFAFQIYGDFSGYTDIAIGTAKLFGFNLMQNFAYPYFSRDIAEFWRRWHISLSSWFKDYLYFPLGGSRGSKAKTIRNTFIIFLVSGFWHGANWTFILWGGLNGLYLLPQLIRKTNRRYTEIVAAESILPSLREFIKILTTFLLTCLAWIFFRADSISHAFTYIYKMFSFQNFKNIDTFNENVGINTFALGLLITLLIAIEWIQRKKRHGLEDPFETPFIRYIVYFMFSFSILYHFGGKSEFIYFQF